MKKRPNLLLTEMQKDFGTIAHDTIRTLGVEKANFFVTLWNDAFVISDAIEQAYPKEELSPSLVWFRMQTMTFSAELYWLHFLFSAGNYSLVFPRLRSFDKGRST